MRGFLGAFTLWGMMGSGLHAQVLGGAPVETTPPLATIIERAVARDDATQKALESMQYHQSAHTEQLGAHDEVTHRQDIEFLVQPGATHELVVLSVKGDNLPSDPDQAMQKARGQETERRKHNFSLKTLVGRFDISLVGTGSYLGQKAYILAFEPRPNQPYKDQTERVLNQLHGRIWISAKDYVIDKTEATLAHPVRVAWIFASIRALDFHYELRTTTNDFGPSWLQVLVEVDAPLIQFRQRQTEEMTQFEPRGKLATVEKSP
jgi:hypothetical protein